MEASSIIEILDADAGSSQPLVLGIAAAAIGFGGFKIFTGKQGEVATKPRKAAQGLKRQVQANSSPSCLIGL